MADPPQFHVRHLETARPEDEIVGCYQQGLEAERLTTGPSHLEGERTREILRRELPPPPAVVLDVGGGPGAYALWLAKAGYTVHLIDLTPLHVGQARAANGSCGRYAGWRPSRPCSASAPICLLWCAAPPDRFERLPTVPA